MHEHRPRTRRRTLPDVVPLAPEDERVGRARAALDRRASEDERPVGEQIRVAEPVEVGVRARRNDRSVDQRHLADAQLRGALGVEPAQEVADAVGLVLGHQRRAVAGEDVPDLLRARRAARAGRPTPRGSRARSTRARRRRSRRRGHRPGSRWPRCTSAAAPASASGDEERRGRRQRLAGEPRASCRGRGRSRRQRRWRPRAGAGCVAWQIAYAAAADHGERRDRDQDPRDRVVGRDRPGSRRRARCRTSASAGARGSGSRSARSA